MPVERRRNEVRPRDQKRPILHILAGARLTGLVRTLSSHGGVAPRFSAQVAIMLASALARTPGCVVEAMRVARRVETVRFDKAPVFIVGHWRSGTTLLHNLMSLDPEFCFPTITDVLRP